VPLNVEKLLDKARLTAGLEDFGDLFFLTGLERLVASFNNESDLNELGKITAEGLILENLVNRLRIEECYRQNPEIEDEIIRDPVFIVGLPRTGTTVLGIMLGIDEQTRCLRNWEAIQPCPPPDIRTSEDPRIAVANQRIDTMNSLLPSLKDALPRNADATMADECYILLNMSFSSIAINGIFYVPGFQEWAIKENLPETDASYGYHHRILKLLQWKTPAKRWILRTPIHSGNIKSLIKHYPDARFIWTHRQPQKVLPSICSLIYQVRTLYHEKQDPIEHGRQQLRQWSVFIDRLYRDRILIGDERFLDIRHQDFITTPENVIEEIYRWLGWDLQDEYLADIQAWKKSNPKGSHRPDPSFFGLDKEMISSAFSSYTKRFGTL
jgi:hypothetical protein